MDTAEAALIRSQNALAHPYNSMGSQIGRGLRSLATSGPGRFARGVAGTPFNFGPAVGGVSGLALGAGAGYALGKLKDQFRDDDEEESDNGFNGALIGAALGAGGGTLLGGMREKLAFTAGDLDYVRMRISQDPQIGSQERRSLLGQVSQLDAASLSKLEDLLRTVAGAGIGALVARFLLNAGIGGTLLGAAVGGFLGSPSRPNFFGMPTHTGRQDAYGNPFNL